MSELSAHAIPPFLTDQVKRGKAIFQYPIKPTLNLLGCKITHNFRNTKELIVF